MSTSFEDIEYEFEMWLWAKVVQLRAALQAAQKRSAALETAAIHLVGKIKRINDSSEYQAVWQCAQLHRGPYHGESYEDEMNALAALLAAHSAAESRKP